MKQIIVRLDDHSPEVLAALRNAVDRAGKAMGGKAAAHAQDNLTRLGAVDTGRLRGSIKYMVREE